MDEADQYGFCAARTTIKILLNGNRGIVYEPKMLI